MSYVLVNMNESDNNELQSWPGDSLLIIYVHFCLINNTDIFLFTSRASMIALLGLTKYTLLHWKHVLHSFHMSTEASAGTPVFLCLELVIWNVSKHEKKANMQIRTQSEWTLSTAVLESRSSGCCNMAATPYKQRSWRFFKSTLEGEEEQQCDY